VFLELHLTPPGQEANPPQGRLKHSGLEGSLTGENPYTEVEKIKQNKKHSLALRKILRLQDTQATHKSQRLRGLVPVR